MKRTLPFLQVLALLAGGARLEAATYTFNNSPAGDIVFATLGADRRSTVYLPRGLRGPARYGDVCHSIWGQFHHRSRGSANNPNGDWRLYTVDDVTGTDSISGLAVDRPDDLELLLVAPGGQTFVPLGDAGGTTTPLAGINLTFDDSAGSSVPDATAPASGTYRPSSYDAAAVSTFLPTHAQVVLRTYTVGTDIPDDGSTGLLNTQTISLAGPHITGTTVGLSIEASPGKNAFLGDLYAYVEHAGTLSVLLNRPGRGAGQSAGFDDNQPLSVTFADGSPDIHNYRVSTSTPLSGPLTGTWGPDGRATDPSSVLSTDSRTLPLSGFIGADPNGDWRRFISDLSGGGAERLTSWTLALETTAVPEPQVWVSSMGLLLWAGWRLVSSTRERRASR